jgi:hypothetical protein
MDDVGLGIGGHSESEPGTALQNERALFMSKSAIRLLPIALGFLILGACTPASMQPHGGQSFPLVNPSFMSWPVSWFCDPASVGYCPANG